MMIASVRSMSSCLDVAACPSGPVTISVAVDGRAVVARDLREKVAGEKAETPERVAMAPMRAEVAYFMV